MLFIVDLYYYIVVCTAILVMMWLNLSQSSKRANANNEAVDRGKVDDASTVDCSGANRGLFLGVLALVATIISMIVYFVLVGNRPLVALAIVVSYTGELVLYVLALTAICMALYLMWDLAYDARIDARLDSTLNAVGLAGIVLYSAFAIVVACHSDAGGGDGVESQAPALVAATHVVLLLQAVAQTLFVVNGLRRRARLAQHALRRPGRQPVTFLLVCNVAMWGLAAFEMLRAQTNPVGSAFLGVYSWRLVAHAALPLATFYRFHSAVCIADVWQNAYQYMRP